MNTQEFNRYLAKHPQHHKTFDQRPHWNRRQFFQIAGAGVTGSILSGRLPAADVTNKLAAAPRNTARNAVFILLAGAPSHIDTFDYKQTPSTPLDRAKPESIGGVTWPTGILPKLGGLLGDIAIVRSVRAWAAQHGLSQTWYQIGRSPAGVLGDIAPNIGSIVAIEKQAERRPDQIFPPFLALNSNGAIGSGYLEAKWAPFKVAPSTGGLPNITNPDGAVRYDDKYRTLRTLDDPLRINSPIAKELDDYDDFYLNARKLIYNQVLDRAFQYSTADSQRYGNTGFGNACLVAKQVLAADQGTRYIQITLGGWDHHSNIYAAQGNSIFSLGAQLDNGVSELIKDLKSAGLFDQTLIVMLGEFGRTVGPITAQQGRDHFQQQFVMFAGGGVKGGRILGATDAAGAATIDFGWTEGRDVRAEDVEATIYSALGINWTYTRWDDPFKRGFEYVPGAAGGLYRPIDELWG
jgi:hypothetical protein